MPEIPVGAQISDLVFHHAESTVYTSLLTGEIKAFRYDEQGQHEQSFVVRPSKRPCRALATSEDGKHLYAVGKGKSMHTIDTLTGKVLNTRLGMHEAAINRIKRLMSNMITTGDDDGVVKLCDPRRSEIVRSYTHHFDFISDFMFMEDNKQLIVTSGDGTLSVIDVRASKTEPFAHSEDQEDELLSVVPIRGGAKTVVGTQMGILSIFNRSSGWGDCVDRVPGHPHSIDALCNLPSSYPSSHSTILTGSSDGLLRAVQLLPTKLIGVVADHGDFPIERIAVDKGGEGRWIGSVGHDEVLRMTDLKQVFEDEFGDGDSDGDGGVNAKEQLDEDSHDSDVDQTDWEGEKELTLEKSLRSERTSVTQGDVEGDQSESESDEEEVLQKEKKRKRKEKDPLAAEKKKKKKGTFDDEGDPSFFSGL